MIMKTVYQELKARFAEALLKIVPANFGPVDPLLKETNDKNFGDYQSNVAMGLAKALKKSPREIAELLLETVDLKPICISTTIAGPGFINLKLDAAYVALKLEAVAFDSRLGVAQVENPIPCLIDFSSPNLAKEMHVGHLRTTITGEVIARLLEFQGHAVERVNHVGDWGTQFGMLLQHIYEEHPHVLDKPDDFHVTDLEVFYKAAKKRFDEDEKFSDNARSKVVLLQSGDVTALKLWRVFLAESLRHCHEIYDLLDVKLKDVGESFYNDRLAAIVKEIQDKGFAVEDKGALCVFLEGFTGREGEPLPFIIRKSDGGYNYASTDLAAMKYRLFERGARRIIIITDIRQSQHFAMLFALAKRMGWTDGGVELCHIGYGMVLGSDKKPFKTRSGDTVRLKDLIDESIERSRSVIVKNVSDGGKSFTPEKTEEIAKAVGLAAIKYFDLSHNLTSDYVFSWDHMLAMDGNTGPYMLYAYARIQSVGRKAGLELSSLPRDTKLLLEHPTEIELAKALLRFGDVLRDAADDLKPNLITEYLYGLSKAFNAFYDKKQGVKILDAGSEDIRHSRLLLCHITAETLRLGLALLGIKTVDAM